MAAHEAGSADAADPDEPQTSAELVPPAELPEPGEAQTAHDRRYPRTIGGVLYLLVLLATAVGIGVPVVTGDWRVGVKIVAGALAAAAGLRLLLPRKDAGMLAVRHRLFDVGLLTSVAIALWVLASTIPNQPGL